MTESPQTPLSRPEVNNSTRLETLAGLSGYQALSPKQQQMVRVSLCIQERGDRADAEFAYEASLGHLYSGIANCHTVMEALALSDPAITMDHARIEGYWSHRMDHEEAAQKVFHEIETRSDLEKFLVTNVENGTAPMVLYLHGNYSHTHTALVLGRNKKGELMIWHKAGTILPYELVTVEELFEKYHHHGWAVDSLENHQKMVVKRKA